jgi:hypothetical protein
MVNNNYLGMFYVKNACLLHECAWHNKPIKPLFIIPIIPYLLLFHAAGRRLLELVWGKNNIYLLFIIFTENLRNFRIT